MMVYGCTAKLPPSPSLGLQWRLGNRVLEVVAASEVPLAYVVAKELCFHGLALWDVGGQFLKHFVCPSVASPPS